MLRRGGLLGLIRPLRVVGEAGVVLACEAVEVGVDHGGTPVGGVGTEVARQQWYGGGGLEELASIHGGFLPDERCTLIQETARADTLWASGSGYHADGSPAAVRVPVAPGDL
jgi:hypothetical protein